jgi:hypothetical protein
MYSFIAPTGEIIKTKTIKQFADQYGFRYSNAKSLSCGHYKTLNGWCSTSPKARRARKRFQTVLVREAGSDLEFRISACEPRGFWKDLRARKTSGGPRRLRFWLSEVAEPPRASAPSPGSAHPIVEGRPRFSAGANFSISRSTNKSVPEWAVFVNAEFIHKTNIKTGNGNAPRGGATPNDARSAHRIAAGAAT